MRVLFFTPGIQRSAIGRMASLVVRELMIQGHEVTIVRTESPRFRDEQTHEFGTSVLMWNEFENVRQNLTATDLCMYQVGDNHELHEGCLHWMPIAPGIICLHDFFVGHLFCGWASSRPLEAKTVVRHWYGDAVAARFFNYASSDAFIDETSDAAPMTEWISAMALGVVTHSAWGCDRVLAACPGPVSVIPLPYDAPASDVESQPPHRDAARMQVLTIGHVNPNKRVKSVIKAIGSNSALRNSITYKLVGHIQPEKVLSLSRLARSHGVNLVIAGEVDDSVLAEAIAESDVVSCLRWPTLEAASASAIEAMLYGKAVICTDAGFYSEIPDECIFKVSVENEIRDIASCLTQLIHNRQQITMTGEKARQWASATFSAAAYAQSLMEMARRVLVAKPVLDACRSFSEISDRWSSTGVIPLREADLVALQIFQGCPTSDVKLTPRMPQASDSKII
ncbi:glycosyltransferase family 1 protein [Burkholderia anthina]|uniref:glycosyltransferase family 4 protein n=1 Tax=Burkholderia anthina TaxID=179879 RepID=UPI000F5FA4E1|nr:glycosyltransferase [Burkholderia anthina]RQX84319.1 glycosyltransferase family 1 protein [Burkholderia anthina]